MNQRIVMLNACLSASGLIEEECGQHGEGDGGDAADPIEEPEVDKVFEKREQKVLHSFMGKNGKLGCREDRERVSDAARETAASMYKDGQVLPQDSVEDVLAETLLSECQVEGTERPPDVDADSAVWKPQVDDEILKTWQTHAHCSLDILADRAAALQHKPLGLKAHGAQVPELSLMTYKEKSGVHGVTLVQWVNAACFAGRRVRLDVPDGPDGLLSYAVYPVNIDPTDFHDSVVIHPAIGVSVKRAKGKDRTQVPPSALHLKRMWEAGLGGAPHALLTCAACGRQSECGEEGGQASDESNDETKVMTECPLCLLAWHTTCMKHFASRFGGEIDDFARECLEAGLHIPADLPSVGFCCGCRAILNIVGSP